MQILDIMRASPVMPVIVIDELAQAVPLARALVAGGIRVLEVTMRTACALDAVRAIRAEVPDAITGVGTITDERDLAAAIAAGAAFGVSPGSTPALLAAIKESGLPFLPGIMTPSELMAVRSAGFRACKLFPAKQAGGLDMLKALHSPFSDMMFCPTGGISVETAPDFLALPNVACVGGSWLVPKAALAAGDWGAIEALARAASALGKP